MPSTSSKLFVVQPPTTSNGCRIFGKNSVRPVGEVQEVVFFPSTEVLPGSVVKCTNIELEQAVHINSVILSKPVGCWGAEMGANDKGVCIGSCAVEGTTNVDKGLTDRDLVRLGLERAANATMAVQVISDLVAMHGLGDVSGCGQPVSGGAGFMICDQTDAWILEVCAKHWAAEQLSNGFRCLSGAFTIQTTFDKSSADVKEFAIEHKLWSSDEGEFNFSNVFSTHSARSISISPEEDLGYFSQMVTEADGGFSLQNMLDALRHRDCESCAEGFVVAGSQVSVIPSSSCSSDGSPPLCVHWLTATSRPSLSFFKPFVFCHNADAAGASLAVCDHTTASCLQADSEHVLWSAHRRFLSQVDTGNERSDSVAKNIRELEQNCVESIDALMHSDVGSQSHVESLFEHMVDLEINFY